MRRSSSGIIGLLSPTGSELRMEARTQCVEPFLESLGTVAVAASPGLGTVLVATLLAVMRVF